LKFKTLVQVLPIDDKIIDHSLASNFTDIEDAIQHYTAIENDIKVLLTRNTREYKNADITVMTAQQYLKAGQPILFFYIISKTAPPSPTVLQKADFYPSSYRKR
jgi:hypothetical protein